MPHLGKDPTTGHLVKAASGHLAFNCAGDFCSEESPLTVSIVEAGTTYDETFSVSSSDLVYFRFRAQGDFKLKIFVGGILKYDSGCILGSATFFDSGGGPLARLSLAYRFGVVAISGTETLRIVIEDCDPGYTVPPPLIAAPRFWDFAVGCECSVLEGFGVVRMLPALTSPTLPGYEQGTTDWVSPWEHAAALSYGIQLEMANSSANSLLVDFDATNFLTTGIIFGPGFFPGPTAADFFLLPTPAATSAIHFKQDFVGTPTDLKAETYILCSSSSSSSVSLSSSSVSLSSSSSSSTAPCFDDSPVSIDHITHGLSIYDNTFNVSASTRVYFWFVAKKGARLSVFLDGNLKYDTGCMEGHQTPTIDFDYRFGAIETSSAGVVRIVIEQCGVSTDNGEWNFRLECCPFVTVGADLPLGVFSQQSNTIDGETTWTAPFEHSTATNYDITIGTQFFVTPVDSLAEIKFDGVIVASGANATFNVTAPAGTTTITVHQLVVAGTGFDFEGPQTILIKCNG